METTNDCFIAALKKKLKEQGRGAKQKFAAQVIVSPNHLSDILSQRKNAGQKLKERIAAALNMSFEDMLVLGRLIVEGREDVETDKGFAKSLNQESRSIDDFLAMAARILESDTPYRQALINNLIAFHQAIGMGSKEAKAIQMIGSLQEELEIMRRDIEELKRSESGEENLSNSAAS